MFKNEKRQQCYPSSSGKTDLFSSTYFTVCFRVGFNPVVILNIALNVPFRSDCFPSKKLLLKGWLLDNRVRFTQAIKKHAQPLKVTRVRMSF